MPAKSTEIPSRRMTLGPVPSNGRTTRTTSKPPTSNRRMSMEPAASSIAGAMASSSRKVPRPVKGRASMIPSIGSESAGPTEAIVVPSSVAKPTAASRRRSIAGGEHRKSLIPPSTPAQPAPTTSQNTKADGRPINDKVYQQEAIKRILTFLNLKDYVYPVSARSLSRPSSKEFTNIITFLMSLANPFGTMKLEDEIVLVFKQLGYPYTLSKTAIVASGSTHAWPSLLAALDWLVEHLTLNEREVLPNVLHTTDPFESLEELDTRSDLAFFEYLHESYIAFMQNDSLQTQNVESEFSERISRDDQQVEAEIERHTELNNYMAQEIETLKVASAELPMYQKKREDYATDLEQFLDLLRNLNQHRDALKLKIEERSQELQQTNENIDQVNSEMEGLTQAIGKQELSVKDIIKMEVESKGISESMDRLQVVRKERQQQLQVAGTAYLKCLQDCKLALERYNTKVHDLSDYPHLAAELSLFQASLREESLLGSDRVKILGVDLSSVVKPVISKQTVALKDNIAASNREYHDTLDRLEKLKDDQNQVTTKKRIVQDKILQCEETLHSDQEVHQGKMAVRQREKGTMVKKVSLMRNPVPLEEQMATYQRQIVELEHLRAETLKENEQKKREVKEEVESTYAAMIEWDRHFDHSVRTVRDCAMRPVPEYRIIVPSNLLDDDGGV